MTEKEWLEVRTNYVQYSWEELFYYKKIVRIDLCWSLDPSLPYAVNVSIRQKRRILPGYKWILAESQKYASQEELLGNFTIDGKKLDELYEELD